jgi:hypothetical protein
LCEWLQYFYPSNQSVLTKSTDDFFAMSLGGKLVTPSATQVFIGKIAECARADVDKNSDDTISLRSKTLI